MAPEVAVGGRGWGGVSRDWAHPCPHLRRDWAHPCPHLRRDWAHPCPHLRRDWARRCPHLRQNWLTRSAMSGVALPATLRARACRFEVNWLNSSIWAGRTWNYTTVFAADPELRHTLLVFDGGAPTHPRTYTHNPPTHPQAARSARPRRCRCSFATRPQHECLVAPTRRCCAQPADAEEGVPCGTSLGIGRILTAAALRTQHVNPRGVQSAARNIRRPAVQMGTRVLVHGAKATWD